MIASKKKQCIPLRGRSQPWALGLTSQGGTDDLGLDPEDVDVRMLPKGSGASGRYTAEKKVKGP